MYKDNPNNRRLNRVGKPLGSVKDPAKKTLSGKTPKGKDIKYKLPKDQEKLKKLQEETKKLKSMTVAKPGQLKKLQEETKKLKSMVEKQKPKTKSILQKKVEEKTAKKIKVKPGGILQNKAKKKVFVKPGGILEDNIQSQPFGEKLLYNVFGDRGANLTYQNYMDSEELSSIDGWTKQMFQQEKKVIDNRIVRLGDNSWYRYSEIRARE